MRHYHWIVQAYGHRDGDQLHDVTTVDLAADSEQGAIDRARSLSGLRYARVSQVIEHDSMLEGARHMRYHLEAWEGMEDGKRTDYATLALLSASAQDARADAITLLGKGHVRLTEIVEWTPDLGCGIYA